MQVVALYGVLSLSQAQKCNEDGYTAEGDYCYGYDLDDSKVTKAAPTVIFILLPILVLGCIVFGIYLSCTKCGQITWKEAMEERKRKKDEAEGWKHADRNTHPGGV